MTPNMVDSIIFSKFMHQAYHDKIEMKLSASITSLAVASEITYKYHHSQIFLSLIIGLFTHLFLYWYLIPLFVLYFFPILRKLIQLWFSFIDTFSSQILRLYSTKLCQILSFICILESNDNICDNIFVCLICVYNKRI